MMTDVSLDIRNVDRARPRMMVSIDPSLPAEWAVFVSWRPFEGGDVAGFQMFTTVNDTGKPELKK